MSWLAVKAVTRRELNKTFRQRGRLLSAMVRPLIWLLVIGSGVGSMLAIEQQSQYLQFLVPGVVAMTLLFAALLSALTLVYDKEFGVMRMMMIAPIAHGWIVVAKLIAAVIIAMVQAILLLLILVLIGLLDWQFALMLLAPAALTAVLCASMGALIAVWSHTLDNFAVIMNFVIFPVFFLSGALYPVTQLPDLLRYVVLVNPFSYGVDLLKHASQSGQADFSVTTDLMVIIVFSIVAVMVACWRFSRESVHEPLFRGSKPGKK
ncbi:ABC transporter, permease protein [Methylophaga frappieri]|uniref:Transport permease protein n=1 Tax=Methylophaga frappieri (strain ATCC BAA-2434 / DSM 25690 / JAM7) TaxID=754477 RepID=I1YI07_METFJ|nr:ABC transporter permease [Methylophaga frappieri]AFJ02550.1 ABC transporter, permease protein [Methylophaga frappieri]